MKQTSTDINWLDSKTPFSYGWINVSTSVLGNMMAFGVIIVFTFSAFVGPITAEFGWSRGLVSGALTLSHVTMILALPFIGAFIDNYGVRAVLIPATIIYGLVLCSLNYATQSVFLFYLIFALLGVFGAGTGPISYSRLIVDWFEDKRGLALGIGLSGIGLGAFLMPRISHALIGSSGWRGAYLSFGLAVLILIVPILFLLLRDRKPNQLQNSANNSTTQTEQTNAVPGLTLAEAVHTSAFIKFLIVSFLVGFSLSGVLTHYVPMLIDSGLSPKAAIGIVSNIGLALILGRILAGYLMDRFFAPYVASIFFLGPVLGFLLLAFIVSPLSGFIGSIMIGAALGAEFDVIAYLTGRYFGRKSFGKLYAVLFSAFTIGSGLGALMMGISHDTSGSYTTGLIICSCALFVGIVLLLKLGAYPKFNQSAET